MNYEYNVTDGQYLIIGYVYFVQTCRLDADTRVCVCACCRLNLAAYRKTAVVSYLQGPKSFLTRVPQMSEVFKAPGLARQYLCLLLSSPR